MRRRLARIGLVASPFALLAIGALALLKSPWPTIMGLALHGRHVVVVFSWPTAGLGTIAAACFVAALVISYGIRREPR